MNQKSAARNSTVSISSFRCLDVQACLYITCVHTYMHTQLITSVSSYCYLQTCLCLSAVILTTHWVQYAECETLRAGLSKLPNSLHLSCFQEFHDNFWLQTTALEQTNPLRRYDSFLQKIKSKDKLTSCLHIDGQVQMPTKHFEL